jgi:hypothetical protein
MPEEDGSNQVRGTRWDVPQHQRKIQGRGYVAQPRTTLDQLCSLLLLLRLLAR